MTAIEAGNDIDLKSMQTLQTNFWDSHHADNKRINHAEQLNYSGKFSYGFSSKELVQNWQELNEKVSLSFYYNETLLLDPKECLSSYEDVMAAVT